MVKPAFSASATCVMAHVARLARPQCERNRYTPEDTPDRPMTRTAKPGVVAKGRTDCYRGCNVPRELAAGWLPPENGNRRWEADRKVI